MRLEYVKTPRDLARPRPRPRPSPKTRWDSLHSGLQLKNILSSNNLMKCISGAHPLRPGPGPKNW